MIAILSRGPDRFLKLGNQPFLMLLVPLVEIDVGVDDLLIGIESPRMKTQKRDEDVEGAPSEEVRRLMDLLQMLARATGLKNAALARRADVPLASLNRYFRGDAQPRLDFVLKVVRAMRLEVREFFELAYPKTEAPTAAYQKVTTLFNPIRHGKAPESAKPPEPEAAPEDAPLRREDVEMILDDFRAGFLRELREILEGKF
jgi:hypothetical protein